MKEILRPEILRFLGGGLIVTLEMALLTILFSTVIGTVLGIARYSKHPVFGRIAGVYIEAVRNVPMLLFILVMRFMTPLPPVPSGTAAMTIFTSAVIAEIVRGGLNSISKGQWEAGRSQGFSYVQILIHIILPQAYRNMIPAIVSQFITVVKDTSFVWAVGTEDLFGRSMIVMGKYGGVQIFNIFMLVALTYFVINYSLSLVARNQQNRMVNQHH